VKFALLFASFLLFAGCSRDTKVRDQIAGTWVRDDTFEVRLAADGSFISQWIQPTKSVTFQGMWRVHNGDVVTTLTNCIAQGTTNFQAVGSVDRWVIVRLDRSDLVWSNNGQTISLRRK
jgi:hypothetical protein